MGQGNAQFHDLTRMLARMLGAVLAKKATELIPLPNSLGHTMRKYRGKLLITPRKSKVKILRQKISCIVQSAKADSQLRLLRATQPAVAGLGQLLP